MEFQDSKTRLKQLAEAAEITVDSNIPIRRYYRSGAEMLRMAKVYKEEGNLEAAYVLYLKYITLFLEKIKSHRDYSQVLPAEKKKSKDTLKLTLSSTEEMKPILSRIFEEEHSVWMRQEEARRRDEERRTREEEEKNRQRREQDSKKMEMIEKDRQFALWTQAQIDQGLDVAEPRPEYKPERYIPSPTSTPADQSPPSYASVSRDYPSDMPSSEGATAPTYNEVVPSSSSSFPSSSFSPEKPAPPTFDRSAKPAISSSSQHDANRAISPVSQSFPRPTVPDRSTKPVFGAQEPRGVIVPEKLIKRFLEIAKSNSDRNVETLGMLGGKLCRNRFTVTHLLIPKQSGKSDRCDLEGHEELGDMYDREDIILVGWIHTHPAYDVFLSSVDMHNQYEYQNMLQEFVAIVCSIKFNETGYLTLTDHGMAEIGNCSQENFHPHSKDPPLFSVASHVTVDKSLDIIISDLRA